jgi:hypothetical protein
MMSKYYTEEELEMLEHFETLMNNRPERVYCDAEYYGEREFEWTKGTWHIYSSNMFYNFSTVEYVRGDLFKELEEKLEKVEEKLKEMLSIPNSEAAQDVLKAHVKDIIREIKGEE